jgi:hypothetical protein
MRDVDEHIQLYVPVLRRIVVLVAVIIAVPVVLWTITVFVRTYVAPPKVPTFRSLAEQTFVKAAQNAAVPGTTQSSTQPKPGDPAPIVEARATTTDANSDAPRTAFVGGRGDAAAAPLAGSQPPMPAPARTAALTATQTPPASSVEDDLPAAGPITGRVPLPRHRPQLFAMAPTATLAQTATAGGIPVPRDRPVSAPDPAPVVQDAPFASLRDYNR